eukprot:CAMPEP_0119383964 /NCGR_PEP_ID=MMETSP1334-20130426/82931_1 /TAXON_ID=127549 /ORGANISM="Calcidiscus leptoporus, Strain RCC1130" /LENGTH=88 /DNA_ID=CAMNT_0007404899 /DNA_START=21 /DNA_END=284 /DNA_ORIENTATION=-
MRPLGTLTFENAMLAAELASDPTFWRSFTPGEMSAFGLPSMEELADSYIRVANPSSNEQWWYKPLDTTAVQSPSAHGSPNEGALFGFR